MTTALEAFPTVVCPTCGGSLSRSTMDELALFRHGGYGATRRTITDRCGLCAWGIIRSVQEVRPPAF